MLPGITLLQTLPVPHLEAAAALLPLPQELLGARHVRQLLLLRRLLLLRHRCNAHLPELPALRRHTSRVSQRATVGAGSLPNSPTLTDCTGSHGAHLRMCWCPSTL